MTRHRNVKNMTHMTPEYGKCQINNDVNYFNMALFHIKFEICHINMIFAIFFSSLNKRFPCFFSHIQYNSFEPYGQEEYNKQ